MRLIVERIGAALRMKGRNEEDIYLADAGWIDGPIGFPRQLVTL